MTAIYARQSVERKESISIEMQIESCVRQLAPDEKYQIFTDRGYSGTNTGRPAFRAMMAEIDKGEIQEVYVYKLDRISRSLCDFAEMMQIFRKKGVTLRSCRESFDTQTEIGGMLLNLLMMFAELEQKTIAGRVRDNYHARAQQHLALGGVAPYGYEKKAVTYQGKKTVTLAEIPSQGEVVRAFYRGYGLDGKNLEQLVQEANQKGLETRNHARWSNSSVLRILRSPIYVRSDLAVVRYFRQQGAELLHPTAEYCQGNGCILFGSQEKRTTSRLTSLQGEQIAAGLHPGLVDSALWLGVQQRLQQRGGRTNRGTGRKSWLQGVVICGICGEHCYVRNNGKGLQYSYFVCRGKRLGICPGLRGVRVDDVEQAVECVMAERAAEVLPYGEKTVEKPEAVEIAVEELTEQMQQITREMGKRDAVLPLLRQELGRLWEQREKLLREIRLTEACFPQNPEKLWKTWWEKHSEQRRQAVGILVEKVVLGESGCDVWFW